MAKEQKTSAFWERVKEEHPGFADGEYFDIRLKHMSSISNIDRRIVEPFEILYSAFGRKVPTGCSFEYKGRLCEKKLLDFINKEVKAKKLHLPLELAITQVEKEFKNLKEIPKKTRRKIEAEESYSVPEGALSTCYPFNIVGYICCVFPEGESTFNRYGMYLIKTEGRGFVKLGKGKMLHNILPQDFIASLPGPHKEKIVT